MEEAAAEDAAIEELAKGGWGEEEGGGAQGDEVREHQLHPAVRVGFRGGAGVAHKGTVWAKRLMNITKLILTSPGSLRLLANALLMPIYGLDAHIWLTT